MSSCAINVPGLSCAQGKLILVGLGVGVVLVALLPVIARHARGLGSAAGGAAVSAADGFIGEVVNSAGDIVGVPRTNQTQCEADLAAGRYWDASWSCPAGTFLKGVFS